MSSIGSRFEDRTAVPESDPDVVVVPQQPLRIESEGPGLRIAFVLDDSLDPPDGVQQYILTLGREYTRRGHEVHYLVGRTTRTDVPNVHSLGNNVPVSFNRNRMRTPLPVPERRIVALLADIRPDVLHVQAPFSPMLAARVIEAAPATTGIVSTFHIAPNSVLVQRANDVLERVVRRATARIDRYVAVSRTAADFARDTYGTTCAVVPCPIDLAHYADAPRPENRDGAHLVFLGRLVARKGPDLFLDALGRAEERGLLPAGTRVTIGGDGPMRADLERAAARLSTPIEFIGTVAQGPKPALLASADIAVFPSLTGETFGIVLTEAMAAGARVVIGGDNAGYRETLADRAECLFDPRDSDAFARLLHRGLTDTDYIERTSTWQREHVRTFAAPRIADALVTVYRDALASRRALR